MVFLTCHTGKLRIWEDHTFSVLGLPFKETVCTTLDDEAPTLHPNYHGNVRAQNKSRTFHLFPLLPPDIRIQIWEAALLDNPRMVRLRVVDLGEKSIITNAEMIKSLMEHETPGFGTWQGKWHLMKFESPDTAPALLSANYESRCIALDYYVDSIPCSNNRGIISCNLENEIIYLENFENWLEDISKSSYAYAVPTWFRGIKRLAVKNGVWQGSCFRGRIRCYETVLNFTETLEKLITVDDRFVTRARLGIQKLKCRIVLRILSCVRKIFS